MALPVADLGPQAAIDLRDRRRELRLVRRQQLAHPPQRDAGLGEGADRPTPARDGGIRG
jgi:hypothetical protein